MKHLPLIFIAVVLVTVAPFPVFSQDDGKVEVFLSVSKPGIAFECTRFEIGSPAEVIVPEYPLEARSLRLGGAVRVSVAVGKSGKVIKINGTEGPEILVRPAKDAAIRSRFSASRCDGKPVPVDGLIIFNFVPVALADAYVFPAKASEFTDIKDDSRFYEAILTLTENYKLAFGYADGKFYPAAPLTKGDFTHFLRLTLDLLQTRAEVSRIIPREIELYAPANPLRVKSAKEIVDLESERPYADSVGFLISKYDIALINNDYRLEGGLPMTQNEVIGVWKTIFGSEAVPVNFTPAKNGDRIMSRGEFALFLHESLFVLTYKVLP